MRKIAWLAALAIVLLVACGGGEKQDPTAAVATEVVAPGVMTAEPALTPSGPALRICVDVSPGATGALPRNEAARQVRAGWPEYARLFALSVEAHEKAGAGRDALGPLSPLEIDAGCPDGYVPPPEHVASSVKPGCTAVGSPYHMHIFLAERSELEPVLRPVTHWVRMTYEMGRCTGHQASELSAALYVVAGAVANPVLAGWALGDAFGFTTILRYLCGHPSDEPRCQGISPPQP